jgi:hypothetical protein
MGKNHASRGNYMVIKTQDRETGKNIYHNFYHLDELPDLEEGSPVNQGQEVGLAGSTGGSTAPHLHWSIARENPETGEPYFDASGDYSGYIDPAKYLADVGGYDWAKDYELGRTDRYGRYEKIPDRYKRQVADVPMDSTPKGAAPPKANESQLRYAIQEALKRKFSPLKEAEEKSSALLYQVVLVLSVSKPIRDIAGKLNRIRAIEGVTIVSHEREEDTVSRGDVVAKVKFHPMSDMMTATTYINQYLVPQINSSKMVPEVKVLQVVQGTLKEI